MERWRRHLQPAVVESSERDRVELLHQAFDLMGRRLFIQFTYGWRFRRCPSTPMAWREPLSARFGAVLRTYRRRGSGAIAAPVIQRPRQVLRASEGARPADRRARRGERRGRAALISKLGDSVSFYKIGLELAYAGGLGLASELKQVATRVFLDLKLHDIGATVERATLQISRLGVDFLTIHGFTQTVRAARPERATAVCVAGRHGDDLVRHADLREAAMRSAWRNWRRCGRGRRESLASTAILSPLELAPIRALVGSKMLLVTPGVRPAGAEPTTKARDDAGAGDPGRGRSPRDRTPDHPRRTKGGGGADRRGNRRAA